MHFSILGPLEVRNDGALIPIRGTLRRTLLAALLLNRDTVVSADRLTELLWDRDGAPSAATPLYNQIMRLRQVLDDDGELIRAIAPGYLIHARPDQLDLTEFTELCTQARQAVSDSDWFHASARYTDALALWRGEILADVPDLHGHASVQRFQEDRLIALQGRIEADLNLGRHDELIGELTMLIDSQPLREVFRGQLMLALQRSGRQADALDAYHALRRMTIDELGLEPGTAIQALHAKILNADPTLAPPDPQRASIPQPSPAPRQLPADTRLFTGRRGEIDELVSLALETSTGSGTVVISAINGMGGVGKTALAIHAAHTLREHYPDGQLFIDLHGYSANLDPIAPENALDYLLRTLGVPPLAIPGDAEERAALYRSRLAETRTLIVLDNAANAAQVHPLLPAAPSCLVLITSRSRLTSLDDAHLLALDTLPAADAAALLHDVAGPGRIAADEPVDELIELCGHMPLAIRIMAARLRHRDALTVESLCADLREERSRLERLSDGERDLVSVFDSSLTVLSDEQRRLFRLLGLIPGPDFDAYAAAHLIDTDPRTAGQMLEALLDHNLLIQHMAGRYRFHDLLRMHASGLAAEHKDSPAALDRLFNYYLATAQAADRRLSGEKQPVSREAELVFEPALNFAGRDQGAAWLRGERANLLAALDHRAIDSHRATSLSAAMIRFCSDEGPWSLAADLNSKLIAAAQRAGDRLAEAKALLGQSRLRGRLGNPDAAVTCAEHALAISREIGHRPGEADALFELASLAFVQNDYERALEPAEHSLAIFEAIGDRNRVAFALIRLGAILRTLGQNGRAADYLSRSMTIYAEEGNLDGEASCLLVFSRVRDALGDFAAVRPMIERALLLYRQSGRQQGIANVLQEIARQQLLVGEYDDAVPMLNEALVIHRNLGFRLGEGNVYWELGRIRFALGDFAEALQLHHRALEIFQEIKSGYVATALLEIARVHHAKGDLETATDLARQAVSAAEKTSDPIADLEVRNLVAKLKLDVDGPESALNAFRENTDTAIRLGHPLEQAKALEGTGRCEIRLGRREIGLDHLRQAIDLYEQMGVTERGPAAAYLAEVVG